VRKGSQRHKPANLDFSPSLEQQQRLIELCTYSNLGRKQRKANDIDLRLAPLCELGHQRLDVALLLRASCQTQLFNPGVSSAKKSTKNPLSFLFV
jgi:hypothetical protein